MNDYSYNIKKINLNKYVLVLDEHKKYAHNK